MSLTGLLSSAPPHDEYAGRILDATRAQLTEHGLRRTSMADVVQASGVSKATLFRRFATRTELLDALLMREIQQHYQSTLAYLDGFADPLERFTAIATHFMQTMHQHPVLQRLLETDPDILLPLLTLKAEPVLAFGRAFLQDELARLEAAGYRLNASRELCAELLIRPAHSFLLSPTTHLPLQDTAALTALVRATLLPMVVAL